MNGPGTSTFAGETSARTRPATLELRDVSAAYGRFRALFGVSFSVLAGSVTALVGPNGAGKSTIARVVTGLVPPTRGRILFAGEDVTGLATWRLVRRGIAHAPEGRSVFATLDVEDNLRLTFVRALGRKGASEALARAYERFPRLADRRRQLAGTLSGGEQRMLALARVLAVPPRLLVVDELSLGLAPASSTTSTGRFARSATRARRCSSSSSSCPARSSSQSSSWSCARARSYRRDRSASSASSPASYCRVPGTAPAS